MCTLFKTRLYDPHNKYIISALFELHNGGKLSGNLKLPEEKIDLHLLKRLSLAGLAIGDQSILEGMSYYVDKMKVSSSEYEMFLQAGLIASFRQDDTGIKNYPLLFQKKVETPSRLLSLKHYKNKDEVYKVEALYAHTNIQHWEIYWRNGFFQDLKDEYHYVMAKVN